ncbi:MAG: ABC-2 family transporter protein [Phycisphaerales bacterium]
MAGRVGRGRGVYVLEGMQATFMAPNRTRVTEYVREGTLDFVLIKPVDSQFWLSVRSVSLWGVPNIVLGLAILLYVIVTRETPPTLQWACCSPY